MKYSLLILLFSSFYSTATIYRYDDSNKLQQVTYDNGMVVSYEYDTNGNLVKVTPTVSTSGKDDGTDNGSDDTPATPEPEKKSSSGGAFSLAFLFFAGSLIATRSPKVKTKLKRTSI